MLDRLVCRERGRRPRNSHLAVCSYDNRVAGDRYTRDALNKAGIYETGLADADRGIFASGTVRAGEKADVGVERAIFKSGARCVADGHVPAAACDSLQRLNTEGAIRDTSVRGRCSTR